MVSLEKQRLDALIRAFKAKEAQIKAEKSKNASEKQLQAKKDDFKALKKKHKDEIKHLQRKHKAALKKAEDWGFKKGKRYQLDLMNEALTFFDAEFRLRISSHPSNTLRMIARRAWRLLYDRCVWKLSNLHLNPRTTRLLTLRMSYKPPFFLAM